MAFIVFNSLKKAAHYVKHMNATARNRDFYFKVTSYRVLKVHTRKEKVFIEELFLAGEQEDIYLPEVDKDGHIEVIGRIKV